MKNLLPPLISAALMAILLAATAYAATRSETPALDLGKKLQDASKRTASHEGNWVTIDTDNTGSTASAALNQWSRYIIQCQDETHICWGTAGAACTAATTDGTLPSGAWYEFVTTATSFHVSGRNANSDSTCRILEAL